MRLIVNGKPRDVDGTTTLLDFLLSFNLNPALVAVELNAEIIRRDGFADIVLRDGDRLEIIHMVGGGS